MKTFSLMNFVQEGFLIKQIEFDERLFCRISQQFDENDDLVIDAINSVPLSLLDVYINIVKVIRSTCRRKRE